MIVLSAIKIMNRVLRECMVGAVLDAGGQGSFLRSDITFE